MKKYFMIFGIVFFSFLAMTACSSSNNEAPAAEEGSGEEARILRLEPHGSAYESVVEGL